MAASPSTNAGIRTTTAPTMLEGSQKDNILPSRARAVVNFRLLPGDSITRVLAHVRRTVDDGGLEIAAIGPQVEASPLSPTDDEVWRTLQLTIRQTYPDAVVAPYLVVGATDARHFRELTPHVYRFAPNVLDSRDLARMHGTDERVPVDGYLHGVRFYAQLIQNLGR
jgi:carboxypeptidase PM20D1